jgi:hypothetical protein
LRLQTKTIPYFLFSLAIALIVAYFESQLVPVLTVGNFIAYFKPNLFPVYSFGLVLFLVLFILILLLDGREHHVKEDVLPAIGSVMIVVSWISFSARDEATSQIIQLYDSIWNANIGATTLNPSIDQIAAFKNALIPALQPLQPVLNTYNLIGAIILFGGLFLGLFYLWSWLEYSIACAKRFVATKVTLNEEKA